MALRPTDFKSVASTSSATSARRAGVTPPAGAAKRRIARRPLQRIGTICHLRVRPPGLKRRRYGPLILKRPPKASSMLQAVAAISALLLAAAILLTGNGLQSTLISVRANLEGFPTALIGVQMSAYFAGFVLGCRINPSFIKSVGHIRTFVALASVASASALAHSIVVDVAVWSVLRAITGFCFAGLFMII